eukprot:6198157-Pleurochrysis_carterae.AAC.2
MTDSRTAGETPISCDVAGFVSAHSAAPQRLSRLVIDSFGASLYQRAGNPSASKREMCRETLN